MRKVKRMGRNLAEISNKGHEIRKPIEFCVYYDWGCYFAMVSSSLVYFLITTFVGFMCFVGP